MAHKLREIDPSSLLSGKEITAILNRFANETKSSFFCSGGFVRDCLTNHSPQDLDLFVLQNPQAFINALTTWGHAHHLDIQSPFFSTSDQSVRLTFAVERESLRTDIKQIATTGNIQTAIDLFNQTNDFTIDTLALCFGTGSLLWLIGSVEALADLEQRRLVLQHSALFTREPLTIIRALSLSDRFRLSPELELAITHAIACQELSKVSFEERYVTFLRACNRMLPSKLVETLFAWKVLPQVFADASWSPELKKRIDQLESLVAPLGADRFGPYVFLLVTEGTKILNRDWQLPVYPLSKELSETFPLALELLRNAFSPKG